MSKQLDALQILRGIAATLVVFDHLVTACLSQFGQHDADLRGLWFAGAVGVKIFFCISGYIITQSLLAEGRQAPTMVGFYQRRLIRVLPLYWLATALYAIRLVTKGSAPDMNELVQSLFFIPYADAFGQMRPVLGLGWSLNFEMFFYLVLGQALWLRTKWGPAFIAAIALAPLWVLALWVPAAQLQQVLPGGTGLLVSPVLGYFLAGVVLAYVAPAIERVKVVRWPGTGLVSTLLAVAICGLVAVVLVQPDWLAYAEMLAVVFAVGSVLLCALQPAGAPPSGWLVGLTKRFGDASYSTYLSHVFIISSVAAVLARVPGVSGMPFWGIALVCLMLMPLFNYVGLFVHIWVEKPLMAWCGKWLKPAPSPKPQVQ